MEKRAARRWEDILAEELEDPEFREQWEHTALARAVALALVQYRVEHHVSQTALAKLLGVKQPTVALGDRRAQSDLGYLTPPGAEARDHRLTYGRADDVVRGIGRRGAGPSRQERHRLPD
jgi:hypothetical protein